MAAALVGVLLMTLALGVLPLGLPLQLGGLLLLMLASAAWLRWRGLPRRWLVWLLAALPVLWLWGLLNQPGPGPGDPVQGLSLIHI